MKWITAAGRSVIGMISVAVCIGCGGGDAVDDTASGRGAAEASPSVRESAERLRRLREKNRKRDAEVSALREHLLEVVEIEAEVVGFRRITACNYDMGNFDVCKGTALKLLKPEALRGREITVFLEPTHTADPKSSWHKAGARFTAGIVRGDLNEASVPIHDSLRVSHFQNLKWIQSAEDAVQ